MAFGVDAPQQQAEGANVRNRVEAARAAEVEAREAVRRQLQALTSEYQATQTATRSASQAVRCAHMLHGSVQTTAGYLNA